MLVLMTIPQAPILTGWLETCLETCQVAALTTTLEKRKPNLRESKSVTMHGKSCLIFAPAGHLIYIVLDRNQTWPLLQIDILSFSSKGVCCIAIFKKLIRHIGEKQWFCLQNMQKWERPRENCLPTRDVLIFFSTPTFMTNCLSRI